MFKLKRTLYKLAVQGIFHIHFVKVMEANIISGFLDLEGGERNGRRERSIGVWG